MKSKLIIATFLLTYNTTSKIEKSSKIISINTYQKINLSPVFLQKNSLCKVSKRKLIFSRLLAVASILFRYMKKKMR